MACISLVNKQTWCPVDVTLTVPSRIREKGSLLCPPHNALKSALALSSPDHDWARERRCMRDIISMAASGFGYPPTSKSRERCPCPRYGPRAPAPARQVLSLARKGSFDFLFSLVACYRLLVQFLAGAPVIVFCIIVRFAVLPSADRQRFLQATCWSSSIGRCCLSNAVGSRSVLKTVHRLRMHSTSSELCWCGCAPCL